MRSGLVLLVPMLLGARVVDDVARLEAWVRSAGGHVVRLTPQFAEAPRALRLELPAASPAARCHHVIVLGPPSVAFRMESLEGAGSGDVRSTRGVVVLGSCGAALPPSLAVHVVSGRGVLEARLVSAPDRLDEEALLAGLRPPPDLARDRTPSALVLPVPRVEALSELPAYRRMRIEADRFGRATIEETWAAGCRRLIVGNENPLESSDLDVVVDGPGLTRWLEDKGPAAGVDRVVCTPPLEPATLRVTDATPGATLRIEYASLPEIEAFALLRAPTDAARLSALVHAADLAPTPLPAIVLRGVAGATTVAVPRQAGRCEAILVSFGDGRRGSRATLLGREGPTPFLRVGDGAGFALARCEGQGNTFQIAIETQAPWTLATLDLGASP